MWPQGDWRMRSGLELTSTDSWPHAEVSFLLHLSSWSCPAECFLNAGVRHCYHLYIMKFHTSWFSQLNKIILASVYTQLSWNSNQSIWLCFASLGQQVCLRSSQFVLAIWRTKLWTNNFLTSNKYLGANLFFNKWVMMLFQHINSAKFSSLCQFEIQRWFLQGMAKAGETQLFA